jgi:hypothetical protein
LKSLLAAGDVMVTGPAGAVVDVDDVDDVLLELVLEELVDDDEVELEDVGTVPAVRMRCTCPPLA